MKNEEYYLNIRKGTDRRISVNEVVTYMIVSKKACSQKITNDISEKRNKYPQRLLWQNEQEVSS